MEATCASVQREGAWLEALGGGTPTTIQLEAELGGHRPLPGSA
jgi:hypothetical protein